MQTLKLNQPETRSRLWSTLSNDTFNQYPVLSAGA